ncbi:hypothetical protein PILCRDRAFT_541998 [Piloderma croceum F 1598]|uniref:non-specific serine/threonine protein kinase n=1 Tax=Piloderma croceum (strain F 1598) TaxID=765440 RepID=A0A0C3BRP9_PILCF|nr:hypothetical protein PILCRDRAFT_541998 [Piloderma croceum F 1598]
MFSFFTCPAISAVRETDSSISSSHCLPSHSKLVLRPPEPTDDMICSIIDEDTLSAPSPCAGVGTLSDDLDFSKPLKRSTSRRPPRIITLLKGVPAPPVLTPTNSPLVSPNNAELVPGSDLLHFDDDGALFYCMPEPNSEPASMSESYSTRCLAFAPLTPIMECSEPYDLGEATAFPSQCGLSGIQTSLSTASFQPSIVESVSHFDLIVPLPPSSEQISYFAHLDSVNSGLDDIDLSLPNQYPEVVSETIEIQAPSPSRRHIDSVAFHRLIHSTWNDVDGGNSGVDVEGPPALEHCLTSGESTPYGPITPIALSLNDAGLMITSDSDSYFGATGSGFKSKKPSPFSSLLYVGRPTTPFELPSVSVFDPFGLDDDTLPPCHFESVHVGVDIVNELLADEEEEPEAGHVISPFDQLKHDILCDTLTTTEQGNPATEAFVVDHTASSDFADSISGKIISSVDMLALSKRVASWIDGTLDAADDNDNEIADNEIADDDARDEAEYNVEYYIDDSDSEADDEDEDFPPIVLEHRGVKYTISGELGQGTYGQVVLARTSLGEEVAIKICGKSRDGMTSGQLRKVILNERKILVRISAEDEPFLTQPLACFQDETNVYFVLRMYPKNVAQILQELHSVLPMAQIKLWAAELLLGLQSLHSLRVVHRDLKPDNVLISPNGHLAIADFGFAKSFSKKGWVNARMTEPLGTAGYLAPEILDHHLPTVGYSSAVDIWGYGMILLEMLLGKRYIEEDGLVAREYMNRRLPFVVHDDIDRMVKDHTAADLLHMVRHQGSWYLIVQPIFALSF